MNYCHPLTPLCILDRYSFIPDSRVCTSFNQNLYDIERAVFRGLSSETDAEVSDLYDVLPAGNRLAHRRLPRGRAFFPLVVCALFDLRAVVTHDKDLPIRLRRIRISHLVLEAHAGTRERDELAVGRPRHNAASFPFPFVSRFSEVPSGLIVKMSYAPSICRANMIRSPRGDHVSASGQLV